MDPSETQPAQLLTPPRHAPTVRRPRSEQTRLRLLSAALKLFRERGYYGAGTNDIGAAAGLTGPSIYRHFATKDELLVAAVLEGARKLGVGAAAARHERDPLTALRMLSRSFVDLAVDDPDLCCVYFFESRHLSAGAKLALEDRARQYLRGYERLLAQLLPQLSGDEIAVRVRSATYSIGGLCLDLPSIPTDRLVSLLTDRMLATLLSPAPDTSEAAS